jgi:hypothetical protein
MKDAGNSMCLDVLDKALFVVCLDDANPETASEMCSNMLCEFAACVSAGGRQRADGLVSSRRKVERTSLTRGFRWELARTGTTTRFVSARFFCTSPVVDPTSRPHSFKSSSLPTEPPGSTLSTRASTATPFFGSSSRLSFPSLSCSSSLLAVNSFVADVYTELILRFAKSINSASATLFKAKISPWANGAGKKAPSSAGVNGIQETPEEIDTVRFLDLHGMVCFSRQGHS